MTLLAAFKSLLYRYSRQSDLLIGTPIANRNHLETEGLIGFFVNTLVLRSKISDHLTFRELLRMVRETALEAYTHQDLPFDKLVEELRPERDLDHTPIFQCMFVLQNLQERTRSDSEWSLMGGARENGPAQFDLTLNMGGSGRQLVGSLEYNTQIFEHATITRMIRNFETLLAAIVRDPSERLACLSLLSQAEHQQVLCEWNKTQRDYPSSSCFPELFGYRVSHSPNALALAGPQGQCTYRELNRRATQLAQRLRRAGVGPESVVAVYLERSVELVIAFLGVLKSGAAYLPLDPTHARVRLSFMLKDSGAVVVITGGRFPRFPFEHNDLTMVNLDDEAVDLANEAHSNPSKIPDSENLAYVLYTSGSTGRPKGVLIRHGSLVNHNLAVIRRYGLNSSDRVLQFAAMSFDVAVEELFPTLVAGATVVLAANELFSPEDLLQFIERERVTVANLPSSYWHELVVELSRSGTSLPPALRLIVIGSERAAPEKLTEWQNLPIRKPQLINAYGPTEATITTTTYLCPKRPAEQVVRSVPVGRPIANTQVYLLDANLQPVPLGVPGELCIAGDSLARGYLNQPAATAEKFVPHPFSDSPGARLYKTGDRARYLSDSNVELLGRTDQQIKFRGFRIELGEIESVLAQEPKVRDAVVFFTDRRNGQETAGATRAGSRDSIETLAGQLAALEMETGRELLREIAETSEQQAAQLLGQTAATDNAVELRRKSSSLEVRLSVANGFINTPQPSQRNWLLQRTLEEFVADLTYLDGIARRLVRGSERPQIEDQWEQSAASYDGSQLLIDGQQVMQDWERPLMQKMAEIVTQTHGDVLELGFGMGISASCIQQHGVRSHTIVECNKDVVNSFQQWKLQYPQRDICLIVGQWQDVTDRLQSYDGIFFDTYPLSEDEFDEYVIKNITFAEHFFPVAAKCLRPGGIFTYYTNEIDSFSRRHQQLVLKYFSNFTLSVVRPLFPPPDCHYWWADSMVAIQAVK